MSGCTPEHDSKSPRAKPCTERPMDRLRRTAWIAACASALLLSNGCALMLVGGGLAAGAGTVSYLQGELIKTNDHSLDQTWTAVQAAMKGLELPVVERDKDALGARLVARATGDKRISVVLKNKGERLTELRIRVGIWGDQVLSRRILDAIEKEYPGN